MQYVLCIMPVHSCVLQSDVTKNVCEKYGNCQSKVSYDFI